MTDRCRLCGKNLNTINIAVSLNDEIDVNVTFKYLVEYYCRIELGAESSLPQNVCYDCKSIVENFIMFCDNAENIQLKLKDDKCLINVQRNFNVNNHDEPNTDEQSQSLLEIIQEDQKEDLLTTSVINEEIKLVKRRVNNIHNRIIY